MRPVVFTRSSDVDIELLTKARMSYCLRDAADLDQPQKEAFYQAVRAWTVEHVAKGDYLGYFGYLGDELVCSAGLLIMDLPPILTQVNRKQGYVLSFFTYPQYRRKGYGTQLMRFMIEDAKTMGFSKLTLLATDEGVPVYRKTGFEEPSMLYMERKS